MLRMSNSNFPRQFSRPVEYDPTLALQAMQNSNQNNFSNKTREDTLKDDLGFESDSSNENSENRKNGDEFDDENVNNSDEDEFYEKKKKSKKKTEIRFR